MTQQTDTPTMASGTHPDASPEEHALIAETAARLGFTDVRLLNRDAGCSPLIYARWRGAPVALSLRTGLAGGFSVAFYRGPQPPEIDEYGDEYPGDEWDEVADTGMGHPETALVLGAALLEAYADGRETTYQNVPTAGSGRFLESNPNG